MTQEIIRQNAYDLENEFAWFAQGVNLALSLNCGKSCAYNHVLDLQPPNLQASYSSYAQFVKNNNLSTAERFLVVLALAPQVRPELLDVFMARNTNTNQIYTEFGGRTAQNYSGFIPTGETYIYLLCGARLDERLVRQQVFSDTHFFGQEKLIWLTEVEPGVSQLKGTLVLAQELCDYLTTGKISKPKYSSSFPAKLLSTSMHWDDLVLSESTAHQLEDVQVWIKHQKTLMDDWGMAKKLKPGYRCLFYGPSGTGKSLTAALLGKRNGMDVYRIDLSKLVSKYIGETEKNLAQVFDKAEHKNWLLFFDEADSVFGKRTSVGDAHDRYANQEVSYLLQRIEDYNGLVVLATNLKENIDEAFLRRFHASIYFPIPEAAERSLLWQSSFSANAQLDAQVDLKQIANDYTLTGGAIINVVQYSSLMALERQTNCVRQKDILEGIRRELAKGGRTM